MERYRRVLLSLSTSLALLSCASIEPARGAASAPPAALALNADGLSWDQLGQIEAWLQGAGPDHYPDSEPQAELALAEGRLNYAKRDQHRIPAATLARRLKAAEDGFRLVLASPEASALQSHRARVGLDAARSLRPASGSSAAPVNSIQPRSSWGARSPLSSRLTRQRASYRRITVHHSAPEKPLSSSAGQQAVYEEIQRIQRYHMEHVSPRCGDIGYHFLIGPRGKVYEGRSLHWRGAHAGGSNNDDNIGVCLLGNFESRPPTAAALSSLEGLLDDLRASYSIPRRADRVLGHGELKSTACPGTALQSWVTRYRR